MAAALDALLLLVFCFGISTCLETTCNILPEPNYLSLWRTGCDQSIGYCDDFVASVFPNQTVNWRGFSAGGVWRVGQWFGTMNASYASVATMASSVFFAKNSPWLPPNLSGQQFQHPK